MKTLFTTPASPRENGYNESFNSSLRDELFNREIFYSLAEPKVLIEAWRPVATVASATDRQPRKPLLRDCSLPVHLQAAMQ